MIGVEFGSSMGAATFGYFNPIGIQVIGIENNIMRLKECKRIQLSLMRLHPENMNYSRNSFYEYNSDIFNDSKSRQSIRFVYFWTKS